MDKITVDDIDFDKLVSDEIFDIYMQSAIVLQERYFKKTSEKAICPCCSQLVQSGK